jgi:hypothetical protein
MEVPDGSNIKISRFSVPTTTDPTPRGSSESFCKVSKHVTTVCVGHHHRNPTHSRYDNRVIHTTTPSPTPMHPPAVAMVLAPWPQRMPAVRPSPDRPTNPPIAPKVWPAIPRTRKTTGGDVKEHITRIKQYTLGAGADVPHARHGPRPTALSIAATPIDPF